MEPIAVYIHWPWCKKKCPYCDFNSHVAASIPEETYVEALLKDFKSQFNGLDASYQLVSIFFGGGTPTLMHPRSAERLIRAVCDAFHTSPEKIEVSLEGNPTSAENARLADFKASGVNRVSIGIQSLQNNLLRFLGREHSAQEAVKTVENACIHFNNVNLDLIYGLPEQTLEQWKHDLSWATSIGTTHLSAYQLTVEPNTTFFSEVRKQKWQPIDSDSEADFFELTHELLNAKHFKHYEISNHAKEGFHCIHNQHIWQYGCYMGVGAGAHGRLKQGKTLFATQNYKKPEKYIEKTTLESKPYFQRLTLDERTAFEEKLLMGLRLREGIPFSATEASQLNQPKVALYAENGYLNISENHIRLTERGLYHLNTIYTDITEM